MNGVFYPNVKPNQNWAPEPAQRYNDVNALLSQFGPTGAGRSGHGMANRTVYSAVNRTGAIIAEGMAVEPSGGDLENDELVPVKLSAAGTSAPWGVLLTRLAPGEIGPVLMTGVATVTLSVALPAGTAYVAPGAGGRFAAATSGRAQVIATKDLSAIIIIGSGGGDSGYSGYFKVIDTTSGTSHKVKIVDGANLSATIAGYATVSGQLFAVAPAELTITASGFIYLKATISGTGDDATISTPVFEFQPAHVAIEPDIVRVLISRVFIANSTMAFTQEKHGEIVTDFPGSCDSDSQA